MQKYVDFAGGDDYFVNFEDRDHDNKDIVDDHEDNEG